MSEMFFNSLWLFLGVVSGAAIQFTLNWIVQRQQRSTAKRLFRVETAINREELRKLSEALKRKKERFVARQVSDVDFFVDMSGFNYRIIDPLVNTGHFHALLGPDGVTQYFRFANELNIERASWMMNALRAQHEEGQSLGFLDWVIDTKLPEWDASLSLVEEKLGARVSSAQTA
ncbi:hypothetical protein [Actibacterium sp. MT2.3-13A]|uniref:hypothetical protein n=1 Tax=Actibacterium sp. MT2.3-13A TaxID=2828332 RepID=UPI001BADCA4B|nr:hypothetical protein [Actibacterium sp. MT2.3-13A]